MRDVCYYFRVSQNDNIVLLAKLKDAPGVVDGDRMFGKNRIYYRVWKVDLCEAFQKIGHGNQLNVCCKRLKCGNEQGGCHLECDGQINMCRAQTKVAQLSKYCVN